MKSPVTMGRERDGREEREGERKKKEKKKNTCLTRTKKKSPCTAVLGCRLEFSL